MLTLNSQVYVHDEHSKRKKVSVMSAVLKSFSINPMDGYSNNKKSADSSAENLSQAKSQLADMRKNHLFNTLSAAELAYWQPYLERVDMPLNHMICEAGRKPTYMFFPTTAIASLMYTTEDGASSEVAVIGNDGVVGISLFLTDSHSLNNAVIQCAGEGYILRASAVKNIFNRDAMLRTLLRYSQDMITQVTQNSISNRHYSVDQQLSRRLLLSLDRVSSNDLRMTHEMLANILGVRRESVTEAAIKLQQAGAISYSRGHITILNRLQLEKSCHECYTAF